MSSTPLVTIDLRREPEMRWADFGYDYRFVIRKLLARTRREATLLVSAVPAGRALLRAAEAALGMLPRLYGGHDYVRELKGLADAANVPLRDLYLANIIYDIESCRMRFTSNSQPIGCTGMIHGGSPSPMISRNMDWVFPTGVGEHSVLFRFVDDHGEYLSVGFPGVTGVISAISSHGFALTVNQAPHMSRPSFGALPALWLTRLAMDAGDSFEAAREIITTTPAASSCYLLLAGSEPGDAARIISRGSSDEVMNVGEDYYAVVANHEPGEEQDYESDEGDSYDRYLTLEKGGAVVVSGDVAAAKRALSKWPVCHADTVHQMVMLPAQGELHLRCPHLGQRAYTRHRVG